MEDKSVERYLKHKTCLSQDASELPYMADGREYLGIVTYMLAYSFMLCLPHTVSSYQSQDSGVDGILLCSMAATSLVFKQFPYSDCKDSFSCIFLQQA